MISRLLILKNIATFGLPLWVSIIVATPLQALACRSYVIEDGYVNVRTRPSTQYPVVGRAYEGSDVNVVDSSGGWLKITYPYNGWVSGSMIGTDCRESPATNSESHYPYTIKIGEGNGGTLIAIRQTPTWADLTKQERKSARENIWRDYQSEYQSAVTVNFYTSKGFHMAQYSSACGGRCFTKE